MVTPSGFDSNFVMTGTWSAVHINSWFYYYELMQDKDFVTEYKAVWEKNRSSLESEYKSQLAALQLEEDAFNSGRRLDSRRYNTKYEKVSEQVTYLKKLLTSRYEWLDGAIKEL